MNTTRATRAVLASMAVLLLMAPVGAFAASNHSNQNSQDQSSQTATQMVLGEVGGFVNVGSQNYHIAGGQLTQLYIAGNPVPVSGTHLEYEIQAQVNGNSVSGQVNLRATATTASGHLELKVSADLVGQVPGVGLPLDPSQPSNPLACLPNSCTSEIPAFFVGMSHYTLSMDGNTVASGDTESLFENVYLNPFGNPITIESADGMVALAATYTTGISQWSGVQVAGAVVDANGNPVGSFTLNSHLTENLVTATEHDEGTTQLSLSGLTPAGLNNVYSGSITGSSTIPTAGSFDCSGTFPSSPFLPGTCTATGSTSTGHFNLRSADHSTSVDGTYVTNWSVPAVGFVTAIQATFSSNDS